MGFTDPKRVSDYIRETSNAYSAQCMSIAVASADDVCMYQGNQWNDGVRGGAPWVNPDGTLKVNYNPDSGHIRVTQNETTKHVLAAYSATDPESIEAQVFPGEADAGVGATVSAQIKEYALNACLRSLRFLNRAKVSNFHRSVIGWYGIGLRTVIRKRALSMYGANVQTYDSDLSCFTFHPIRLILDPWEISPDLNDHTNVTYADVFTIDQLRFFFPDIKWDESDMGTVGELTRNEQAVHARTRGLLFQQYVYHSRTKGARVYQVHSKDETGRFGQMWYGVAYNRDSDVTILNPEDPTTPFGGNGMPLAMIYGHPRPESNVGISDVGMVKGDQLALNLAKTQQARYMNKYCNPQLVVDKKFLGKNVNDSDLQDKITNQAGGIISGESNPNNRNVMMPQVLAYPQPPTALDQQMDYHDAKMGEKVGRSDLSRGIGLKSHQPDAAVARILAEGDRLANVRVASDVLAYEHIATVALGTIILGVQKKNPSTLAILHKEGFGPEDYVTLAQCDPAQPGEVRIPVASVRRRSSIEKKQALDGAIERQAISPQEYRSGLADLDMAVSDEDNHMRTVLQKAVAAIIRGEEWQPFPLGGYTDWFLSQLVRGRWDRSVRNDPEAIERLGRAYMMQQQFALQQEAAKQMAMNPPVPQAATAAPQQAEQTQPTNIAEMIEMMAGAA